MNAGAQTQTAQCIDAVADDIFSLQLNEVVDGALFPSGWAKAVYYELRNCYTHDAWGNVLSTTGSMASTLGLNNPLRYRGYIYDRETGLYYLQSRYYDPEMGRFINADAFTSTGQGLLGNNMFAYCLNNPVNMADLNGQFGIVTAMVFGGCIGVLTQFISGIIGNIIQGKSGADIYANTGTYGEYVVSALTGIIGAIPGGGSLVNALCNFLAPAIEQIIDCLCYGKNWDWGTYGKDVIFGLVLVYFTRKVSVDSPKYIRDIKDEASSLDIKGTKKLDQFLEQTQDRAFVKNQFSGLSISIAATCFSEGLVRILKMV